MRATVPDGGFAEGEKGGVIDGTENIYRLVREEGYSRRWIVRSIIGYDRNQCLNTFYWVRGRTVDGRASSPLCRRPLRMTL